MPRINIEDSLFRDNRFFTLLIKLKSRDLAIGVLVSAWLVAQDFWKLNQNGIPKSEWKKRLLNDEIIEAGLAEDRGDFIYMSGSAEQFAWLTQRIEAGKRGGIANRTHKLPDEERARREGCRMLLNKALKTGKVTRPAGCEECGKGVDLQAHHNDYSKPYEVDWLCRSCHNEFHRTIQKAFAKRDEAVVKPSSLSLSPTLSQTQKINTFDQNKFDRVNFDFETVYKNYPRKIGKTKGINQLKRQVRRQEEFDHFSKAVCKYRELCETQKTEKQFIMHFSTFVGTPQAPRWRDYLDDEVDSSNLKKEKTLREILTEEGQL